MRVCGRMWAWACGCGWVLCLCARVCKGSSAFGESEESYAKQADPWHTAELPTRPSCEKSSAPDLSRRSKALGSDQKLREFPHSNFQLDILIRQSERVAGLTEGV